MIIHDVELVEINLCSKSDRTVRQDGYQTVIYLSNPNMAVYFHKKDYLQGDPEFLFNDVDVDGDLILDNSYIANLAYPEIEELEYLKLVINNPEYVDYYKQAVELFRSSYE